MRNRCSLLMGTVLFGAVVLLSSCARIGSFAEKRANRAAYGNIVSAQRAGLGRSYPFSIDDSLDESPLQLLDSERMGDEPELLSLSDVLTIALANSRSYQNRKESLFIEALNLTEVQKDFNFNYSASAHASSSSTSYDNAATESFGDNGVDGGFDVGVTRTLITGANISLAFSQDLVSYFTSPDTADADNALSFSIVQPLLRGFGPLVTKEPLRQAERNMIYAVRDFKRYQQGFVIDVASQYYSTLRSRDALRNARTNYESAIANRERTESYAKAGRIAEFQAAQARQSELDAADRWIQTRAGYHKSLDDLRFSLGLPVELNVEPDPAALQSLETRGLVDVGISMNEALESAVSNRLDLISHREKVDDKERKLKIQRREFLPGLKATYNVTQNRDNDVDVQQNLSVSLNLPLDWTERRNDYRIAEINLQREVRNAGEAEDDVRRKVRDLWRTLERNRSVYENRLLSVELSARRVESTTLLLKQGKALTRDLLEAQDDLLSSENAATAALVDYTINRLRFWNAIERFNIDPKGMWYGDADGEGENPAERP